MCQRLKVVGTNERFLKSIDFRPCFPIDRMKLSQPRLLPTLLCFAIVGLVAATLPYPTLVNDLTVSGAGSPK